MTQVSTILKAPYVSIFDYLPTLLSESVSEDLVKVIRTNDTRVTISYHPSKEDQLRKSKEGLQGQFVVQYDVDRTSVEKKGGEVHVILPKFIYFIFH